jgi:hypothetical protein
VIEARYDYPNAAGQPRIRKLRYTGKRFKMQSAYQWPDGSWHFTTGTDARFEWSLRALYRLPSLIAALKLDAPAFLCEGEKDADAVNASLMGAGFATSHWQGADTFEPGQAEWFTGYGSRSPVTIVCDNDAAGAWCGWLRYSTLREVGVSKRRLRVVAAPWDGRRLKDAADALAVGVPLCEFRSVRLRSLRDAAERYSASRTARYAFPAPASTGSFR